MDRTTAIIIVVVAIIVHVAIIWYAIYDYVKRREARKQRATFAYEGGMTSMPSQMPWLKSNSSSQWQPRVRSPRELEAQKGDWSSSVTSLDQGRQQARSPQELEAHKNRWTMQHGSEQGSLSSIPSITARHPAQHSQHLRPDANSLDVRHSRSLTSLYSIQASHTDIVRPSNAHIAPPSRNPSTRVANYHTSSEYSLLINQDLTTLLDRDTVHPPRTLNHKQRMSNLIEHDEEDRPRLHAQR